MSSQDTALDEFLVDSLALAATLKLWDHPFQRMEMRGDKAVWVFVKTRDLMDLAEKFRNKDIVVEPKAFQAALTECRRDLFRFLDGE
jgi:hypothetical protein